MLHGGLPPSFLSPTTDREFFSEWIDSFYAKDIQELYAIEKRQPFIQLLELLLFQNGGMADLTDLGKKCGISRPSATKYVEALEQTQVIHVVRPFHGGGGQEIVSQPKIYGFDTGFVCHAKGWEMLRPEDCGHLLENLTLESLMASQKRRDIYYWRTKQRSEVDFVLKSRGATVHAIECKWRKESFDPAAIKQFRKLHPKGLNICVVGDGKPERLKCADLTVQTVPIGALREWVDRELT